MNNELKNFWNDEKRLKKVEKEINKNKEIKKEIEGKIYKVDKKEEIKIKFKEYTKDENKEYKPKYLIIQIILNTVLFSLSVYFDTFRFIFMMIFNFCLIWFYSLISILKNDFKKESNKTVWLLALIFIPFLTPYIYPDFKDVQTI